MKPLMLSYSGGTKEVNIMWQIREVDSISVTVSKVPVSKNVVVYVRGIGR